MSQATATPLIHTHPRPHWLQALDNALETGRDEYVADCPICRQLLLINVQDGWWTITCDGDCTHDELARWLVLDDLRADTRTATRIWEALMLSTSYETWVQLLEGKPVHLDALSQEWLRRLNRLVEWV